MGTINSYNCASGALSPTLPALAGLNVGASCIVEKYQLDGTLNSVTVGVAGADTFDDGATNVVISVPGDKVTLQVVTVTGTKYWKRTNWSQWPRTGGLTALTSQFSLTNSTTSTPVISWTIPAGMLAAGSTFRVNLKGTVQTLATSGTLTFTPILQGVSLAQTAQMPSQVVNAASGFTLEFIISVRTTGASGTAIAEPWGQINFGTPVILTSTSAAATTVNTSAAASTNNVAVNAQWATASASNSLLVQTAVIERVI
jgi:hypothetical protein